MSPKEHIVNHNVIEKNQQTDVKILIVDDNPEMRKLLNLTFSYSNYQIFEAQNGDEALNMILMERPDIILLDIMMPGTIDGIAVCDYIKSSTMRSSHVILLSAKGQQEDIKRGNLAGADFYITKPFSPIALTELVETIVSSL